MAYNKFLKSEDILIEFANNYMIVNKKDFSGVSGYVCESCCTFEFRFIRDMGFDLVASEKHTCGNPNLLDVAISQNTSPNELKALAIECLVSLTNILFGHSKELEIMPVDPAFAHGFHGPVHRLVVLLPSDWFFNLILYKKTVIDDNTMHKFITLLCGTFALIHIMNGPSERYYLASIKALKSHQ